MTLEQINQYIIDRFYNRTFDFSTDAVFNGADENRQRTGRVTVTGYEIDTTTSMKNGATLKGFIVSLVTTGTSHFYLLFFDFIPEETPSTIHVTYQPFTPGHDPKNVPRIGCKTVFTPVTI